MLLKIDWAILLVHGSKFTVVALFYFVFEGNFPITSPGGLYLEGLIHGGAYFRNFTVRLYNFMISSVSYQPCQGVNPVN